MRNLAWVFGVLAAACGGERGEIVDPDATEAPPVDAVPPDAWHDRGEDLESPWAELPAPAISLAGGTAAGAAGTAADGGEIALISSGAVHLDPAMPPAEWPAAPAPGDDALRLEGTMEVDPGELHTFTADGDLVVAGTLGGAASTLVLRAPGGTVFIDGTVTTIPGGAITIEARDVVIRGVLITVGSQGLHGDGGDGGEITVTADRSVIVDGGVLRSTGGRSVTRGGAAGAIRMTAGDTLWLRGDVDASGGDAIGHAPVAGPAAEVHLAAADLELRGELRLRGGAAVSTGGDATGGAAAALHLDIDGDLVLAGLVDARGGPAIAAGGPASGGAAGTIRIGGDTAPGRIVVQVPLVSDGGDAEDGAAPGDAGPITIEPHGGELVVATLVHARGGAARGGDVDGGAGGTVLLRVVDHTGDLVVTAGGEIATSGGASSGTGHAGGAGPLDLLTRDGDFSLAGRLLAPGGEAPDPGGTGGDGGPLHVFTDTDADGLGGNLRIEPGGLIDVSGGAGTTGGSARNNGRFGVEAFPDGRHLIAVLLNSDSAPGPLTDGVIENLGTIRARGAASDGWGGDVIYHGRRAGQDADPFPGDLSVDGHGEGDDGQWFMQ